MRSIFKGMVVLGCMASASTGFADNADNPAESSYEFVLPKTREANDHLKRGFRLYNNQEFDSAIMEFKAGALVEPCSSFDYNLGQSYRLLGRYKEALWHYERFLNNGKPTGEVREAVQKWIAEMQVHIANAARTMPPTEAVSDAKRPGAAGPAHATTSPAHPTTQHDIGTRDAAMRDDRGGSVNWIGWTATAGGVAALGATGFLFLRASSLDDQANMSLDAHTRNELHDQASTRRLASAIVGVGGLALTITGIYVLATQSHHHDRSTTASLDVGLTGRGVVVFGRF